MTGEWGKASWGDLATLEYGKALRGYQNRKGPYPVFGTNGLIGWHTEPLCPHATVVIGRKGAYRGIHYSSEPCFVIDTAFYLKPRIPFDMRWAYYALLTYDINSMDSGSAIPSTSRESFYHLPVQVPPLPEQRAIAHILGTLDDKIELNERMNRTLEAIAQAIFKSWFVDFEPFRDGEFVESELGKIPKGWEVEALGEAVSISTRSISLQEFPDEEFWYYSIPAFDKRGQPIVERGEQIKSNKYLVPSGSILVSKLNPSTPRVWLPWLRGNRRAIASTEFIVYVPKDRNMTLFFYVFFKSRYFCELMRSHATGTTGSRQRVSPKHTLHFSVIVPPERLACDYCSLVQPMFELIQKLKEESQALTQIRNVLLPKLISGEIRVKDAEKFMEKAHA